MPTKKPSRRRPSRKKAPEIPSRTAIERDLPVEFLYRLALREGNRKKPIYEIHKWWARRLGSCFRMILLAATSRPNALRQLRNGAFYQKHSKEGLLVLDPFLGGGTSLVEAVKLGAKVIGGDIDPVACFISKKEVQPASEASLGGAFAQVKADCAARIRKRYRTVLSSGEAGEIINAFWVDVLTCPECGRTREAHPHYRLAIDHRAERQTVFCSSCGEIAELPLRHKSFRCGSCSNRTHIERGATKLGVFHCDECGARTPMVKMVPVGGPIPRRLFALEVELDGGSSRTFKRADERDRNTYKRAARAFDSRASKLLLPRATIPLKGRADVRPVNYGHKTYESLFNKRQLLCLAEIAASISRLPEPNVREFLALAFSDCLAANNMLCAYAFGYRKLTPLFGLHAYRKVVRPVENNVWGTKYGRGSFTKCYRKMIRAKGFSRNPYELRYRKGKPKHVVTGETAEAHVVKSFKALERSPTRAAFLMNRSSEKMALVPKASVDLILTDPPYFDNLPYSELSDFYHVWLRKVVGRPYYGSVREHTPMRASLHPLTKPGEMDPESTKEFGEKLWKVFAECRRVIRPSGILVLTFHHRRLEAWQQLAAAILLNRFRITRVIPLRGEGWGGFHNADGNLRWDAVVCARPTSRGQRRVRYATPARTKALGALRAWKKRLANAKIRLSPQDQLSLARAFLLQELSGARWSKGVLMETVRKADPAHILCKRKQ